ncbi:hypothetical protein F5ESL0263_07690 [Lactobacillus sp. ESL0263]|uniref:SLAP domain-containing protein n=1 Tax=Lactobacillus sp. ESL0263 TaxID=2069350 RepID=UPI000EFC018F|nr:SLAP domain-containing protein [Lactobacillus sp. ESL0263]RMC48484.1 hypothetical protein F5ESL0263_07690 [Lactobacillus sp. ESL0263]
MEKSKLTSKIAAALCAIALTGVGAVVIAENSTQIVSAATKTDRVWLQYGTLKYDLKGPSGRVYRAGTKVVRDIYMESKPSTSIPARPFYLTLIIGGKPGMQGIQDAGGGLINEKYVDANDWYLTDYPSDSTTLVSNATNNPDLSSSDFHPVDSNNPDIASVNRDKLRNVMADFTRKINFNKLSANDEKVVADINVRESRANSMDTTQTEIDQLSEYVQNVIDAYKKTGHLTGAYDPAKGTETGSSTSSSSDNADNTTGDNSTLINASKSRKVRLRKASYRYTSKGKRVSKKLLKKGSIVTTNGKTYRIKGKAYYRIGKNRYIRVANVAK